MTLPNLVIAGAPKCGTTSVFAWLADHPEVCSSRVKETRYLFDRGDPDFQAASNYHDHGPAGYESYFADCSALPAKIVLEATPYYLYQQTALEVLPGLEPRPQIVFLLRKPAERVYSYYQFVRNDRAIIDPGITFRRFVEMARAGDEYLAGRGYTTDALVHSRYTDYVEKWLARFPASEVHLLLFEDLKRDPRSFMRGVAERFGIAAEFYDGYAFRRRNPSYRVRWHWLHGVRRELGRLLPRGPRRVLKKSTQPFYSRINVLRGGQPRSDDDQAVLEELDAEFAPYNERLARATGVDLAAWR